MGNPSQAIQKLAKFMTYVLGRRPDEFGLLLDEKGFTKIKDLLQAMSEESGWKHVRQGHLNELLVSLKPCPIQIETNLIRATDSTQIPVPTRPAKLPKLLYTAIRRKAYPFVAENGLLPGAHPFVVLAPQQEMALRIGRRKDQDPVILSVQVESAQSRDVTFLQFGELLFLADFIPKGVFTGPPIAKEKPAAAPQPAVTKPSAPKTPGSFFLDLLSTEEDKARKSDYRKRKEKDWKIQRKQARKHKAERHDH